MRVHIDAPSKVVAKLFRLGPGSFQKLCAAPCNAEIREAGDRFVIRDDYEESRDFRLAGHGGQVSLRVAPTIPELLYGSVWVAALGVGTGAIGIATLISGINIERQGQPDMARDLWTLGGVVVGAGALISLGGWVMKVAGLPSVEIRSCAVTLAPSGLTAHW